MSLEKVEPLTIGLQEQSSFKEVINVQDYKEDILSYMPCGYAYHRLVCDSDGKPVDYVFLDLNPAFEEM